MTLIKFFKRNTNNFLKSIDTITTKLLTLVLFVITIPLMVVGNFSTEIINQSMTESSNYQLNLNKKIFYQKFEEEGNHLKSIAKGSVERYLNKQISRKDIFKEIESSSNIDFCLIADMSGAVVGDSNDLSKNTIKSALKKIINISLTGETIVSSESVGDSLYKVVALPLSNGINKTNEVLLIGKSFDKITIPQEIKNLTDATVVFYMIKDNKALVLNSNNIFFRALELYEKPYFDGIQLQTASEASLNAPLSILNYFNEKVGDVYIGISKNEFIIPGTRNVKSIGVIAVISLLVAILIAGLFARTITDPILKLVVAAESVALGDLEHEVKIKGNDEMAQLAKTFNQMSHNLKKQEHLRDNFVATLTHDLKVPMLAENQTVTYLLKGAYGEVTQDQREVLELIKSTNNSSLEMIGTLLEVYRYDSGNVRLFESEFDVVELLNDSILQIKSLADDKKIQIKVNSSQEKIMVRADKREIKRVFHNLISNAIINGINRGFITCNLDLISEKILYQPKIDIDSYTTLTRTLDLTNNVVISIEDNGIGLAREDMPLLFQRFSLSKGRKPAGAGLGLYYSYQVIIQHNGNIWAESSEKGGSIFKISLPVHAV
jgi:signal transduction histidine kinase